MVYIKKLALCGWFAHSFCHTHSHDDWWKSPEKTCWQIALPQDFQVGKCMVCVTVFPAADTGCHGDTVFRGQMLSPELSCLRTQRPSGGQLQCGLQRWGPASFQRD